jgi:ABC-type proline/glycine betaine transport system permease subunit
MVSDFSLRSRWISRLNKSGNEWSDWKSTYDRRASSHIAFKLNNVVINVVIGVSLPVAIATKEKHE